MVSRRREESPLRGLRLAELEPEVSQWLNRSRSDRLSAMFGTESRRDMSTLLEGKHLVVTGVMTNRSIAFSVARRAQELGAELILTSFGRVRRLTERTARQLPDPPEVLELDVTNADDFMRLRRDLERRWGRVDGALHSVAFAPPNAIGGNFLTAPAESASNAFEVSAFSMKALAEMLLPLAPDDQGASLVGMDFDASVAWPRYDWMGVAKAALESVNRYIARYLGPHGIRSNLVAAGLLETAATAALGRGWDKWVLEFNARSPLGWDPMDPAPVADAVCFLFSDLARGVSGEILHVDGGLHAMAGGVETPEELLEATSGQNGAGADNSPRTGSVAS